MKNADTVAVKKITLEIAGQKIEVSEAQARELHSALGKLFGLPEHLIVERLVERQPFYIPPITYHPEPPRPHWGSPEITCQLTN